MFWTTWAYLNLNFATNSMMLVIFCQKATVLKWQPFYNKTPLIFFCSTLFFLVAIGIEPPNFILQHSICFLQHPILFFQHPIFFQQHPIFFLQQSGESYRKSQQNSLIPYDCINFHQNAMRKKQCHKKNRDATRKIQDATRNKQCY